MESSTRAITLDVQGAAERLKKIVVRTPLMLNQNLSRKYQCNVYLKREDLQVVRSYKIRGAYNMMSSFPKEILEKGVVCASAGNHAQGFAYSCKKLNIKGVVFMPIITPKQKVDQTRMFGEHFVDIKLIGDTFDDCAVAAKKFTAENQMTFIPPFEDLRIIEGQATVALEILEDLSDIDYLFVPVGGGGLASGTGTYFKTFSSDNLVDWKDEGVILDLDKDVSWAKRNAWAPCIIEKKINGNYKYFYYFSAAQNVGVAVSDNPTGPFVDSGKPLIDKTLEGVPRGQIIDPDVFADPKTGKCYIYWGNGNMAGAELNDDMVSIKPGTLKVITPDKSFREGTYVIIEREFIISFGQWMIPEVRITRSAMERQIHLLGK